MKWYLNRHKGCQWCLWRAWHRAVYHFINGRWKFLIINPGRLFGHPNWWLQRWLASCDLSKHRVLMSLLPLPSINITMQTCLCQLNLFSNFSAGWKSASYSAGPCHLLSITHHPLLLLGFSPSPSTLWARLFPVCSLPSRKYKSDQERSGHCWWWWKQGYIRPQNLYSIHIVSV